MTEAVEWVTLGIAGLVQSKEVASGVRVEGRLGWDRDGEKNVMGRIEAVKMLSGRDSLS